MVNERILGLEHVDVGILVGGPAGYPDIPGFVQCWADTIIPRPFCDGYENKDRIWGIVVLSGFLRWYKTGPPKSKSSYLQI